MIEYLFMKGGSMADNTKRNQNILFILFLIKNAIKFKTSKYLIDKNLLFLAGQHNRRNLINEVVKRGVLTNETDDEV